MCLGSRVALLGGSVAPLRFILIDFFPIFHISIQNVIFLQDYEKKPGGGVAVVSRVAILSGAANEGNKAMTSLRSPCRPPPASDYAVMP